MSNRVALMPALAAAALAASWPAPARADGEPFVDRSFTRRSADNDPDLIVVRERYDADQRTQSLYLRVHDGTPDHDVFGGTLVVAGADIVEIFFDEAALLDSDARWGLPDRPYGEVGRGLEGDDPRRHVPARGDTDDALRHVDARTVHFWFGTTDDIDDLRVLVRYPDEPGPAHFDVMLFHRRAPDPLGFPPTRQGGIQVGSLVDAVPDDGDYSEVFEVTAIKLRVEDLDLVEHEVFVGRVPEGGGVAGPSEVTIDNDFEGRDIDQDNGFDQNGLITPIPAASDLDHLRWEVEPLTDRRGPVLAPDRVLLANAPERLPLGQRMRVRVTVDVPPDTPIGRYRGPLRVWEDNDEDGRWDGTEPGDSVRLIVQVGDPPDAGPDAAAPADGGDLPDGGGGFDGGDDGGADDDGGPPLRNAVSGGDGGPDAAPAPDGDAVGFPDAGGADGGFPAAGDLGDARGGGLDCRTAPGGGSGLVLALCFAAAAVRRSARR